ncbi:MAG TPA: alpha/beta hydrolase [Streptosporangiaceae bacterium]|jgi:pimeloyl-ACP methyl ester carboxylesterase
MALAGIDRHRGSIQLRSGRASYVDTGGEGRAALFVHGLATSSYLWRNVIDQVDGRRRCVAIDLPLHGGTEATPPRDFSLTALAEFVRDCCDALDLADVDLVANDTGGAVAQVFAARHPERLNTLTLTNCETHNNLPPKALWPAVLLARAGLMARMNQRLLADPARARKRIYGGGYQDVRKLPVEIVRAFLEPQAGSAEAARQMQRWLATMNARELLAAEPALRRLEVPTLIVWGTADMFFRTKWAYWLLDTIPGATKVVELPGAKLFFPDERAADLTAALLPHWDAHA